jgi:hypothetical protein
MTRPSQRIVEAVAEEEGCDPAELIPRLHDVVDPDALDRVFADYEFGYVAFSYGGHEVTLYANGEVVVEDDPEGVDEGTATA